MTRPGSQKLVADLQRENAELRSQLATARMLLDDLMFHDLSGRVQEFLGYETNPFPTKTDPASGERG